MAGTLIRKLYSLGAVITLATLLLAANSTASHADSDAAAGGRADLGTTRFNETIAMRGVQDIRTNPAAPTGAISLAHPFQATFGDDIFIGVGTYKGVGTRGIDPCPENRGAWSSYVDFRTAMGTYKCFEIQRQAFTAGSTPRMRITTVTCDGDIRWAVYINDVLRRCLTGTFGSSMSTALIGIEVVTPNGVPITRGYNIDVIGRELETYSTFYDTWGDLRGNRTTAPGSRYQIDFVNDRRINARFENLD